MRCIFTHVYAGIPCFIALKITVCFFLTKGKIETALCAESVNTIFPTVAHFLSVSRLGNSRVTSRFSLLSHVLWRSVVSDL